MSRPSHILVVSSSLSTPSRSRAMARVAHGLAAATGEVGAGWLDLAEIDLQLYPKSVDTPLPATLRARFEAADGIVVATPVYNWGAGASLINFCHYVLDPDNGRRHRPFVVLASAGSLRAQLAVEGIGRALLIETHGVQVGAPIVGTAEDVDRTTGAVAEALVERIDAAMTQLARHARIAADRPLVDSLV